MQLPEWRFRLVVSPTNEGEEIPRLTAEEILFKTAIGWAECHGYGIGGGLSQNLQDHWVLSFGLCATRADQLIPYAEASQLAGTLRTIYQGQGITITGSVEAFPVDEC